MWRLAQPDSAKATISQTQTLMQRDKRFYHRRAARPHHGMAEPSRSLVTTRAKWTRIPALVERLSEKYLARKQITFREVSGRGQASSINEVKVI